MAAVSPDAGSGGSGSGNDSNPFFPSVEDLPRGFYFNPSDDEVLVYLKRKILDQPLPVDIIPTVDVYGTAPDQLPLESSRYFREKECYFFVTRPSHVPVTAGGYWIRQNEMDIVVNGEVEGFKQEFDYYKGDLGSGKITPWHIWEYRMNPDSFGNLNELTDDAKEKIANLVICKVFFKKVTASRKRRMK